MKKALVKGTDRRFKDTKLPSNLKLDEVSLVVFDMETTGIDATLDRITEIAAIRVENQQVIEKFHSYVKPDIALSPATIEITGITKKKLENKPSIDDVLPCFLKFVEGSVLVTHNAKFDVSFLNAACLRQGVMFERPCICTLKMAKALVSNIDIHSLENLAKHYGFTFKTRGSLDDARFTYSVLKGLLQNEGKHLTRYRYLKPFLLSFFDP